MNKPPEATNPQAAHDSSAVPHHLFLQAVEQAALAISITDAHANILYANAAFQRITGYEQAEVIGHNESILSYHITPKIVYETLWAQIRRQRPWSGLLVNKRKDGTRYLAEVTITPVVGAQGVTTHYLGMHRDVTEVHRLERQVQNQKTLIESVVDSAQVAIVLLDADERVLLDNQEYKKLIGDLGNEPALKILASLRANLGDEFNKAYSRHRNFPAHEVRIDIPQRMPRWFSCAISWFEEHDVGADAFYEPMHRHYLLLTIQDISELKRQQEALRLNSLQALLSEQERIQGLRETLAGAVFQLEGPLNMLNAAAHMFGRKHETDMPAASAIEDAMRKSREALETLRDCMPQQHEEVPQPVNINEVLSDVLKLTTNSLLSSGIVVEWTPLTEVSLVNGQPVQLTNMFKQLVNNAIEAVNERRGGLRELRLSCTLHQGYIEVFVEDSGPGISDEMRYKVFQPFFTTKGSARQHLGLGLPMAQETVTRHGGTIDIDPACHVGCRVRVQLPLATGVPHG